MNIESEFTDEEARLYANIGMDLRRDMHDLAIRLSKTQALPKSLRSYLWAYALLDQINTLCQAVKQKPSTEQEKKYFRSLVEHHLGDHKELFWGEK